MTFYKIAYGTEINSFIDKQRRGYLYNGTSKLPIIIDRNGLIIKVYYIKGYEETNLYFAKI